MTQWTPPEHRDPEWTNPDGTERGAGATIWLAVALAAASALGFVIIVIVGWA